jgi:DNA repair protein RadA/Sms
MCLLLAVLERRLNLRFSTHDVYLNIAGGMRLFEPAADLAVAVSLLSAITDTVVPPDLIVFGELGLAGEIRSVSHAEQRIKEASRLGFKKIFVSSFSSLEGLDGELSKLSAQKGVDIQVVKVADVPALCRTLFKG